jgi:hypothetical protein
MAGLRFGWIADEILTGGVGVFQPPAGTLLHASAGVQAPGHNNHVSRLDYSSGYPFHIREQTAIRESIKAHPLNLRKKILRA